MKIKLYFCRYYEESRKNHLIRGRCIGGRSHRSRCHGLALCDEPFVEGCRREYHSGLSWERPDVVTEKVAAAAACDVRGFRWLTQRAAVQTHHAVNDSTFHPFKPGNYSVRQGDSMRTLWLRLASGAQTPVRLVVGSPRTMDRLAGSLANQLMADSASFAAAFHRPSLIDSLGYTIETLPALIVPNTYEVYWTMSPDDFMARMKKEHDRFWTAERKAKAEAAGLTDTEVATLASIVCEETNKVDEMPVVAGLYLNRLHRGIPLQADPTVKFAVGDPTLRRILFVHLATPSPYNTYLNTGLPPGPSASWNLKF